MKQAMRYRIAVRDGDAIAGYTSKRERKRLMPGEYLAIEDAFKLENDQVRSLRVLGGDMQDQGDLSVVLEEYVQLEDFPDIVGHFPLEVLGKAE